MKTKTCCFTGHRLIDPADIERVKRDLSTTIVGLVEKGVVYFGSGATLGFDTLAAETALELKANYPQIKLIMVYPCKKQTKFWEPEDVHRYMNIKESGDKYVYLSDGYTKGCMHKRNRHLVDHSQYCLCYLKTSAGGTAYTVKYAIKQNLTVINIASNEKQYKDIQIK